VLMEQSLHRFYQDLFRNDSYYLKLKFIIYSLPVAAVLK